MDEDGKKNSDAKKPRDKKDDAWQGEKDGEWSRSGEGSHSTSTPSHESKFGAGNRKVTDEDRAKAQNPEKKTKIELKPLWSKTYYDNTGAPGHSSQEGPDDQTFHTVLTAKVSGEALGASVDLQEKKAKLTLVKAKAEGSVFHGQLDVGTFLHDLFFGKTPGPGPVPANPPTPAPMAARVGDLTAHGAPLVPGTGSPNVMIGGMPAWRVGPDLHLCPFPGVPPHGTGPTMIGAPTVLINGFPAARAGDWVVEPVGGPDLIALGCPTVMIGMKAPTPPAFTPPEPLPEDLPWVSFDSVASTDAVAGEVSVQGEGEIDLAEGKGKIEAVVSAEAAVFKGELPLKLRIRIPFTTYYLGLGVTGKATLLALGGEAGAGVKINDGKKLFAGSMGASGSIGPGGLGVTFSLDVAKK